MSLVTFLFKIYVKLFIMKNFYNTYFISSSFINLFYSIYDTHNVKVLRYKDTQKPFYSNLLFSEKILILAYSFITGQIFLPIKIINNIDYLIIKNRNENLFNYGYIKKETFSDFLFSFD